MTVDLSRLLEKAFFEEKAVHNASECVARALEKFEAQRQAGARVFEVVAPREEPNEQWLRERLVHPLIYYCESEGLSVPRCAGVIVALYVGTGMHAIAAEDVLGWASEILAETAEELRDEYGTHEGESALR